MRVIQKIKFSAVFMIALTTNIFAQTTERTLVDILDATYGPGCSLSESSVLQDANDNMNSFVQAVTQAMANDPSSACRSALTALQNSMCTGGISSGGSGGRSTDPSLALLEGLSPGSVGFIPGCPVPGGGSSVPVPPTGSGGVPGSPTVTDLENQLHDLESTSRELTAELERHGDGGEYSALLNTELAALRTQIATLRISLVRARATADDRSARDAAAASAASSRATDVRRLTAAVQSRYVVDSAVVAFNSCGNEGSVMANLTGPIVGLISNLSGLEAGATQVLQSVGQIFSDIVNYFTQAPYRSALAEAQAARAPAAFFCTIERLSDQYCQTSDLMSLYAFGTGDGPRRFETAHAVCALTTGYPEFMNLHETVDLLSNLNTGDGNSLLRTPSGLRNLRDRLSRLDAYANTAVTNINAAIEDLRSRVGAHPDLQGRLDAMELQSREYRPLADAIHTASSAVSRYADPRRRGSMTVADIQRQFAPLNAFGAMGDTSANGLFLGLQTRLSDMLYADSQALIPLQRVGVPDEERNYDALESMSRGLALRSVVSGPDDLPAVATANSMNLSVLDQMSGNIMHDQLLSSLQRLAAAPSGETATQRVSRLAQLNYLCTATLSLPDAALGREFLSLCRTQPIGEIGVVDPTRLGTGRTPYEELFNRRGADSDARRCFMYNQRADEALQDGRGSIYREAPSSD